MPGGHQLDGRSPKPFLIEANRRHPFFVYHPMAPTHGPHVPTPESRAGGKGTKRHTKYFVLIWTVVLLAFTPLGVGK
jgi:hypothetical protein